MIWFYLYVVGVAMTFSVLVYGHVRRQTILDWKDYRYSTDLVSATILLYLFAFIACSAAFPIYILAQFAVAAGKREKRRIAERGREAKMLEEVDREMRALQ